MPDNETSQTEAPWYAAYPAAKLTAAPLSRSEVRLLLQDSESSGRKDFLLIDLRRNDHEVRFYNNLLQWKEC
jgi:arsenical-resistance protein 2